MDISNRSQFIVLAAACTLLAAASATAGERSSGADFLRIEPSARAVAMGGGFGALVDDVHGLYYNPAGLATVGRTQMTATHTEWLSGMQNEFFGFAFPAGPLAWGFSGAYLHAEETERDNVGRPLSTFVVGDGVLTTGIGLRLTGRHHLGFNVKYLNRTLYHRSANGYAGDFGYQCRLQTGHGNLWRFGVVLKNVGPDMGFVQKEKLPTELEAAMAFQPSIGYRRLVTFNFSLKHGNVQDGMTATFGLEATLLSRFHVRGRSEEHTSELQSQ